MTVSFRTISAAALLSFSVCFLWSAGTKEPPAPTGPAEITYFVSLGSRAASVMKSYSEMYQYQELERIFNVKFAFRHPPIGQENEQFNLMLASGDLPDVISTGWSGIPGGPGKLVREGILIKLNELLEKNAPNLAKKFKEEPEVKKQATLDDGTYYMFPFMRTSAVARVNGGPAIRKDWLDRLGLKAPETIDEWYAVLTAFKQKDANGNGDPNDEIPFLVNNDPAMDRVFIGRWRITRDFYLKADGSVGWGPIDPAYKDYLATMQKWYKEGLIDPDYITNDAKSFDAKVTSNKAGAFFAWMNGRMGRFNTVMKKDFPDFNLIGVPWPKNKDGISYTVHAALSNMTEGGAAITKANKKVELTAKILDYGYGPDGNMLFNFGKLGESYTMVNGAPQYTELILKNPQGIALTNILTKYCAASSGTPIPYDQDERYATATRAAVPQQQQAEKAWALSRLGLVLPPLQPSEQESARMSRILTEVNTYVDEMTSKMIMGLESISKFDEFVATQRKMGIDEAVAITQKAYLSYKSR